MLSTVGNSLISAGLSLAAGAVGPAIILLIHIPRQAPRDNTIGFHELRSYFYHSRWIDSNGLSLFIGPQDPKDVLHFLTGLVGFAGGLTTALFGKRDK
jgi:hypothetical protein